MQKASLALRMLVLLGALNAMLLLQQDPLVEGIFFLDLLCATRIDALERQISQLVYLTQNATSSSQRGRTFR